MALRGTYVPAGQTQSMTFVLPGLVVVKCTPSALSGHWLHFASPCLSLYFPTGHKVQDSFGVNYWNLNLATGMSN